MTSLKDMLLSEIKSSYPVMLPMVEIERIAKASNYKISNAERRLRELMNSKTIEALRTEKGAIKGYVYKLHAPVATIERQEEREQSALFQIKAKNY